jgi:hypothetical protein
MWERKHPEEMPMVDLGGIGGGPGIELLIYLVIKGKDQTVSNDEIQSFFKTGLNSHSGFGLCFIDIASDLRLSDYLSKIKDGDKLYAQLEKSAPAFVVTTQSLLYLSTIDAVEVIPISDYATDVNKIYERMGLTSLSRRLQAIEFLKKVNGYLQLKPNVFGLGFNLNDVLADLIKRLEQATP